MKRGLRTKGWQILTFKVWTNENKAPKNTEKTREVENNSRKNKSWRRKW